MYHLTIGGQPLAIETNFSEAHAWLEALQARFLEEEIAIADAAGAPVQTCLFCETPTPAPHLAGELWLCEDHADQVADAGPVCAECGGPLTEDDVLAGETTCLECAALSVEIDLESPLLAIVRARLG